MSTPMAPTAPAHAPAPGRQAAPAWLTEVPEAGSYDALFRLIAAQLHREITSGAYAPGARLPSARQLQRRFAAASSTIQSALGMLKSERMIYSVRGRGSYVRSAAPAESRGTAAPAGQAVRHTASTITDAELDRIYARLAELESRLASYEPRGEAAA